MEVAMEEAKEVARILASIVIQIGLGRLTYSEASVRRRRVRVPLCTPRLSQSNIEAMVYCSEILGIPLKRMMMMTIDLAIAMVIEPILYS